MYLKSICSSFLSKYLFIFFCLLVVFSTAKFIRAQSGLNQNDRLTFTSGPFLIQTMKPDGSDLESLGNGICPVWSPDGTKMLFIDGVFYNPPTLVIVNADGSNKQPITTGSPYTTDCSDKPSWFPNSQKIAFVATGFVAPDGGKWSDIFTMNLDGTGLINLTNTPNFHEFNPQVSPNGQRILYSKHAYGVDFGTYVVNADGSGQTQLADTSVYEIKWSPDGTKTAGFCKYGSSSAICVDGNDITPRQFFINNGNGTGTGESRSGVSWSSDGSRVLYIKNNYVCTLSLSGTCQTTISSSETAMYANADGGGETGVFGPVSGNIEYFFASPDDSYFSLKLGNTVWVVRDDGSRMSFPQPMSLKEVSVWQPRPPCNCQAVSRPQTQTVQSNWAAVDGFDINWRMTAEVSDDDGLVLKDIRLGERYMAKQISVPYYNIETSGLPKTRGELKPDGSETSNRSRLIDYKITTDDEKLVVEATYVLDRIPNGSDSCVYVVQRYEFYKQGFGGKCEPSEALYCSIWKPTVKYKFFGKQSSLTSLTIAQRQEITVENNPENTIALFKDCDIPFTCVSPNNNYDVAFERKQNPLFNEWYDRTVSDGKNNGLWDNIHQTNNPISVDEPSACATCLPSGYLIEPGCPECMHSHWRWAKYFGEPFGNGNILELQKGSKQDFEFAIVKNNNGEDDPLDFKNLANQEPIRRHIVALPNLKHFIEPEKVVLWYVGTGKQNSDEFFRFGGFFSTSKRVYTFWDSLNRSSNLLSMSDDLTSVTANDFYEDGTTTVDSFDPNTLDANVFSPLPNGYVVYNNLARDVETEAEVSGPYTAAFSVSSVNSQADFDKLRILHAEQDPFDPDKAIWVDRTILSPDPQAPDFNTKTIKAKTNRLGAFIVASLVNPPAPNTNIADISVIGAHSPTQIVAGNELTYTITVSNNGSQAATNIKSASSLPPGSRFISLSSTQGSCKEAQGQIVCKLGNLNPNSSAVVTAVVKPTDRGGPFAPDTRIISSTTFVRADENDPNLSNNVLTENATLSPDPNRAPTISIVSPTNGNTFAGLANITLTANAADADGSIGKVEFFDNGELIATVTSGSGNQYTFNWTNVSFGEHSVIAVATDNLGKTNVSDAANIFVNGSASVSVTSPAAATQFRAPANITINATASQNNGSITKVDFYANGLLIGTGTNTGTNQYSFAWNGITSGNYSLTAMATDNNGILTKSPAVPVSVYLTANLPPQVNIAYPFSEMIFLAPASVNITADATDSDGTISQVDFYNNGTFIGTGTNSGANQFSFTWNNLPKGFYNLTAVAKDNQGATNASDPVNFRVNTSVLFVTGSTTLTSSDNAIKSRLQNLGFIVTVKDGTSAAAADANGQSLVVISSTVSPTSVGTKFRTVAVPVVTWEGALFPNMGMTTSSNKDYGTATRQTQIKIIAASHPLAGGLSGTVTVYSSSDTVSWGKPNVNAAKIATVVSDTTKIAVFGYTTGAAMPGLTAPAKRVGLFMFDTSAAKLTNGWNLFDAAVNWATQ